MEKIVGAMPPSVKIEILPTRKYIYSGPDYEKEIWQEGRTWQPRNWTDADIDQFMAQNEWAKDWFKKA